MTINEIYQQIISAPSSGFLTDDNRVDAPYVYSLINTSFATAIRNTYALTKKIHANWYIPYYPKYERLSQGDGCFGKFTMPEFIEFDSAISGLGFIGSLQFNKTFIPVTSRTYFADMQHDKIRRPGRKNYILIENREVELYGDFVKDFKMMLIPANPFDIPTFNQDIDEYPADQVVINEIKKLILGVDVQYIWKTRPDTISNAKDETIAVK